jgi:hypothetical protein
LEHQGYVLVAKEHKALTAYELFNDILDIPTDPVNSLNLDLLNLPRMDLIELGDHFTKGEVMAVIWALPPDKAPGPDGFTGRFLQATWEIIRVDVMCMFNAFWHLDMQNFSSINETLLTLLLKSIEAKCIKDYWLISLTHCIRKLISKVLASWLAPRLYSLVHRSQSPFIQDNFHYV